MPGRLRIGSDRNVELDFRLKTCRTGRIITVSHTSGVLVKPLFYRVRRRSLLPEEDSLLMEISSVITPEIYEIIYRMGHTDELLIADANYYPSALSNRVVVSYATENHSLVAEILKYMPPDIDEEFPVNVMTPDHGYAHEPEIWTDRYQASRRAG